MGLFKKIKYFVLLICLTVLSKSFSQQDSHYTQYMYNMNIVNPAYAGIHESINFRAFSRQQWIGIKGAPSTYTFTVQSPLWHSNLGGAISLITDKIGPLNETKFFGDMSYTISTSSENKLAFGVKVGYTDVNRNLNRLVTNIPEQYKNVPKNYGAFNLGFGAFFYAEQYYFGISIPYVLNEEVRNNNINIIKGQYYYMNGGYVFDLKNGAKIKPSFMYRGVDDSFESMDIALNIFFENGFEAGTSYRFNNAMSVMINYKFGRDKSFTIGYAYEHNFSEILEFNNGSHEIMLMYDIKLPEKQKIWKVISF